MPKTPDSFPGVREDEGLKLLDDGYGNPGSPGEIRYSDGNYRFMDAYGVVNMRTYVEKHVNSHLGNGSDSIYVFSNISPTDDDDLLDGYEVGTRWVNTVDGYEFVLLDNSIGASVWKNTTITGSVTSGQIKYKQIIWGEEAGGLGNNSNEYSFGNGATGVIGIPVFEDCEIVGMIFNADNAGDATTEVRVLVNNAAVGLSIVPGNGVETATVSFVTPYFVNAGDLIGFQTVFAGGASDVRVGAVIEYSIDITAFEGPQGPAGEDTTASNIGGENELFKQKVSTDLEFRTLKEGTGITITQNTNDLEISASGIGLPSATQVGQVLYSIDGYNFTVEQPLTEYCGGWLINDDGELLVVG